MEAWECYAAQRKLVDIKNVDYSMVNHDIATVREFLHKLFLYFVKKKLTSPTEISQNIEFPFFFFPLLEFQKISPHPPTNMTCLKSWSPLLHIGGERGRKGGREKNYETRKFLNQGSRETIILRIWKINANLNQSQLLPPSFLKGGREHWLVHNFHQFVIYTIH